MDQPKMTKIAAMIAMSLMGQLFSRMNITKSNRQVRPENTKSDWLKNQQSIVQRTFGQPARWLDTDGGRANAQHRYDRYVRRMERGLSRSIPSHIIRNLQTR